MNLSSVQLPFQPAAGPLSWPFENAVFQTALLSCPNEAENSMPPFTEWSLTGNMRGLQASTDARVSHSDGNLMLQRPIFRKMMDRMFREYLNMRCDSSWQEATSSSQAVMLPYPQPKPY